jgi:hypothetical protein
MTTVSNALACLRASHRRSANNTLSVTTTLAPLPVNGPALGRVALDQPVLLEMASQGPFDTIGMMVHRAARATDLELLVNRPAKRLIPANVDLGLGIALFGHRRRARST